MKKHPFRALAVAMALFAILSLFAGCQKKEDTRQYVTTIGVVITNDMNYVFDELYVFTDDEGEWGQDFIKNSKNHTKVGSYGCTVEAGGSYQIVVRTRYGAVYKFGDVPLSNVSEGVITYNPDAEEGFQLLITVYHLNGKVDEVYGAIIEPGDAPDHPHVLNQSRISYNFKLENETDVDITRMTMREADAQEKGEVELFLNKIDAGDSATIRGSLYEEDEEITEWVLCIQNEDKTVDVRSENTFNPWETTSIVITEENGRYVFQFE